MTEIEYAGERLMRVRQVMEVVGVSRATLYRLINAKKFPKPVKHGHIAAWPQSQVQSYVQNVIAN